MSINSASCPISNSSEELKALSDMLEHLTLPLTVVLNGHEAVIRTNGTVYTEDSESFASALAFVQHFVPAVVTAQDVIRHLVISNGCLEKLTLLEVFDRHPSFLKDAGLTTAQIDFRDSVALLPCPMKLTIVDKKSNEQTLTLHKTGYFSSEWDEGLTVQQVAEIFKEWKDHSALDVLTVLYHTDTAGNEWRLSDIVALSPFRQRCFPEEPTKGQIISEIKRFLILNDKTPTEDAREEVIEELMNFLYDECTPVIENDPSFCMTMLAKCKELVEKHPERTKLVASCQRLLSFWDEL